MSVNLAKIIRTRLETLADDLVDAEVGLVLRAEAKAIEKVIQESSSVPVIEEWHYEAFDGHHICKPHPDGGWTVLFDCATAADAVHAEELYNATVCSLTEKIKELEEKEASADNVRAVLQKALSLLVKATEFFTHDTECPEFIDNDDNKGCECAMPAYREAIQMFLSKHYNVSGAPPVPENSPSPVPLQEAQSRPVGKFKHNPAHSCGTCASCGEEMVWNIPRMGPAGGFVHKATGRYECRQVADTEPTVAEFLAWLKKKPGSSWIATELDVQEFLSASSKASEENKTS